jgi:hypothetical protein
MIWLLAHPLPPSPFSKIDRRRHKGRLKKSDNLLTEEGEGVGEKPSHTTVRNMVLYKSFNAPCGQQLKMTSATSVYRHADRKKYANWVSKIH